MKTLAFNFHISLDVEGASSINGNIVVRGRAIHNENRSVLVGSELDGPVLNLGFRIFDQDNAILFEDRAKFDTQDLSPNTEYPFNIEIPETVLILDDLKCFVDFLYEDGFWFNQVGALGAVSFSVKNKAVTNANVLRTPVSISSRSIDLGASNSILDRFKEAFGKFDFSNYEAISFLVKDISVPVNSTLPQSIIRSFNEVEYGVGDILPVTSLMNYVSSVKGWSVGKKLGLRQSRFNLLKEMFLYYNESGLAGKDLIPESTISYLNEPVLADGMFEVPMSRLMLWCWISDGKQLRPQMKLDREDIYWWWVTAAMPAKRIPGVFVTDEVVAYLGAPQEDFRARTIPLSRFFYKAYKESSSFVAKYDLNLDVDLISYSFDTLIHNLDSPINSRLIGTATIDFWSSKIGSDRKDVSLFEIALAHQISELKSELPNLDDKDLRRIVRASASKRIAEFKPNWSILGSDRAQAIQAHDSSSVNAKSGVSDNSFTVVGMLSSPSGLGVNSRMSKAAFDYLGLNTQTFDIHTRNFMANSNKQASDVSLFHVNADAIPQVILNNFRSGIVGKINIGFLLWELDIIPSSHLLGLKMLDKVWVPTEFLRDIYSQYTDKDIVNVGKYLIIPELPQKRVSKGPFQFLTSFDFHSGVERKNPLAAVRAFQAAFPLGNNDVQLIVKTTETLTNHWGDPHDQWLQIAEAARRDGRIVIVTDIMSEGSFFNLINNCDCIVTTHRAEGFGYLPAYALYYGKAVISTNYSGTTDFCTPENSYLVDYTSKSVDPGEFIIDVPGATWADIQFDHLVQSYKDVLQDKTVRDLRAKNGRSLIRDKYSISSYANRISAAISDLFS